MVMSLDWMCWRTRRDEGGRRRQVLTCRQWRSRAGDVIDAGVEDQPGRASHGMVADLLLSRR
jgi:hypothetical protein